MTNIGFNSRRVIMAIRQKQEQLLDGDSIPALRIFEWARVQLNKCNELFYKRKKEVITLTAERLESKGFPCNKICSEISRQLADYLDDAYVREVLPSKYKDQARSNNAKVSVENHANRRRAVALQQAIQEHIECESCPEAYDIEKVRSGAYTYEYLQSLCVWLHETIELNCEGK